MGALFWAKAQDPFSRKWFTVSANGHSFKCVAVLPKPQGRHPIIIYAHGFGGTLINDGNDLRQMAEFGLAAVSVEYDQTNEAAFASQFESLTRYVARQKWANNSAVVWVGFSLGAKRMLDFALRHPEQQPRLLVQVTGAGLSSERHGENSRVRCRVLLIHGEQDEIVPLDDTKRLAAALQTNDVPVDLKILSGLAHGLEPERGVVFRGVGEYCRSHLVGKNVWRDYHSIAQWQAEAPGLVWFWLPAGAGVAGWFVWKRKQRAAPVEKTQLRRSELVLRWVAGILAVWAGVESGLHLIPPHCLVGDRTLALAERFSVQPKERADFAALAGRPIWKKHKLQTLLDHVELAGYNRELINWQLDQKIYEDFVLSPVITGQAGEQLNWRRALWEECYPRIRHETSPEDAARIVVRHLRERVTVIKETGLPQAVPDIWLRQLTNPAGFEILYVAALRSVGVPARLDAGGQAEIYTGEKWQAAPRPVIYEAF